MMIWGCMTYYGVGDACWYLDSMNSKGYLGVLKDYVLQTHDWYGIEKQDFIFQQNNASAHMANRAPLGVYQTAVRQLSRNTKTMEELWERIQKIWTEIPIEIIQDLYESISRRIRELHDSKGGLTVI
ncbi:MAG: hypothetical protein J3R72DRAFT_492717 [Linnemannia gamsii]|nr:MAG: hypothetical protein J3R72DRAFT_492717 [Linnemannia gamsii]